MADIRTPAQAAYEALMARQPLLVPPWPTWDELHDNARENWRHAANAAVFATLHCDAADPASGLRTGMRVEAPLLDDIPVAGHIVAMFAKRDGSVRMVVENDDGMLVILRPEQLRRVAQAEGHVQ